MTKYLIKFSGMLVVDSQNQAKADDIITNSFESSLKKKKSIEVKVISHSVVGIVKDSSKVI